MLSEETVELTHDRREELALSAVMNAVSSRGKGKNGKIPSVEELYDRGKTVEPKDVKDVFEKQQEAMEWLSNFRISDITDEEDDNEEVEKEE